MRADQSGNCSGSRLNSLRFVLIVINFEVVQIAIGDNEGFCSLDW